ncbi:RNA polymerase sigma factor SigJ [Rhodococcus fascians]|nr:RNA polymerase sigma factor SigJ [Rhodococcus fascians]
MITRTEHDAAADRDHLIRVGYRMLGSHSEAEDAVQEAFVRWYRLNDAERAAIDIPLAWMTRVVSRICLDVLGSARARRERYVGQWLPEPLPGRDTSPPSPDPADRVARNDSVSLALLIVMDTLGPAERVAFVLHDVFGLPFDEIAQTLDRSPAACRQLTSAARKHVRNPHAHDSDPAEHDRLVRAFAAVSGNGSLAELTAVLAPEVSLISDGGGKISAARNPILGSDRVARFIRGIAAKSTDLDGSVEPVNGSSGIVFRRAGTVFAVLGFRVAGGVVANVWIVLNPDKLRHWE